MKKVIYTDDYLNKEIDNHQFSDGKIKIIPTAIANDQDHLHLKVFGESGTMNRDDAIAIARWFAVTPCEIGC